MYQACFQFQMETVRKEEYDYIILGTGLFQTTLAMALAARGVHVCVVDNNEYYGEITNSFSPDCYDDVLRNSDGIKLLSSYSKYPLDQIRKEVGGPVIFDIFPSLCHSVSLEVQIIQSSGLYSMFNLKRVSPIELINKEITTTTTTTDDDDDKSVVKYKAVSIPSSREALFNCKSFSIKERHQLMKLVNTFINYFKENAPFVFRTPPRDVTQEEMDIVYETMPNFPEGNNLFEVLKTLRCESVSRIFAKIIAADNEYISRKDFFLQLARFMSSVNRFSPDEDSGFLVLSAYGNGELSQALSRYVSVRSSTFIFSKYIKEMSISNEASSSSSCCCATLIVDDGTLITAPKIIAPRKYSSDISLETPMHIGVIMFKGHPEPAISRLFSFGNVWLLLRTGNVVPRAYSCVMSWKFIDKNKLDDKENDTEISESLDAIKDIFSVSDDDVIVRYEYKLLGSDIITNNSFAEFKNNVVVNDLRTNKDEDFMIEFDIPKEIILPLNSYDKIVQSVVEFMEKLGHKVDIKGSIDAIDLATIISNSNSLCAIVPKKKEAIDSIDVEKIIKEMEHDDSNDKKDVENNDVHNQETIENQHKD